MQDKAKPIAIFDSGVGGLSIYQELKRELPNENFVYLADQKNIPYGGRPPQEIRKLTLNCLQFLVNPNSLIYKIPNTKYNPPKLIVVACNTSTVSGIDFYRKQIPNIPIIGVVPVVKTASEITKNRRIAILSTMTTANSKYQKELIEKFCDGKKVLNIGCPNLVSYIEQGITEGPKIEEELVQILKPVVDARCDTLVLGCTHYPFLKKTIEKIINQCGSTRRSTPTNNNIVGTDLLVCPPINILDSSGAIVRQTKRILEKNNLLNFPSPITYPLSPITSSFLTTGNSRAFTRVIKTLIHKKIKTHSLILNS